MAFPQIQNKRFWDLSNASLHYVIKDAHEAAQNMRDIDPVAEGKYLDQVNDASTVLAWRQNRRIDGMKL